MSPGDYTAAQNSVENNRSTAESHPIFWIHPASEPWSESFESDKPENWKFLTIEDGRHGTLNFDGDSLESTVLPPFVDWVYRHTK